MTTTTEVRPTTSVEQTAQRLAIDAEVMANRIIQAFEPDQIRIDPAIHALRRWTGHSKQEEQIELLLNQIRADGQRQPGLVRVNEQGEFVLVFGERRLEAVKRLRAEEGYQEYPYYAEVDTECTEIQALHLALGENGGGRANFTAMEKAGHIEVVRMALGLTGMTRKDKEAIAEFFGWKSAANVDNHLLLLELPAAIQEQIANEEMTFSAGVELARGNREKAGPVALAAKKLADREARGGREAGKTGKTGKGTNQDGSGASGGMQTTGEASPIPPAAGKVAGTGIVEGGTMDAKPVVTAKHVRQAQKTVAGSVDKQRAPKMSEFCDLIETWDGPSFGDSRSPARRFIQTVAEYGRGKLRGDADNKLLAAFEEVVFQKAGGKAVKRVGKKVVKKAAKKAEERKGKAALKKAAAAKVAAAMTAAKAKKS